MRQAQYVPDQHYIHLTFTAHGLNFKEFERCVFDQCDFSACTFLAVTFIDCVFNHCIFSGARINYVALRTVAFNDCTIKGVNFSMCDRLIFELSFTRCILDFSQFYALKLKQTRFSQCSLIAADFMGADLTGVVFDHCDLYRAEFSRANASKSDFRTSRHYAIDPAQTKINKAQFSLGGLKGLLAKHEIVVVD